MCLGKSGDGGYVSYVGNPNQNHDVWGGGGGGTGSFAEGVFKAHRGDLFSFTINSYETSMERDAIYLKAGAGTDGDNRTNPGTAGIASSSEPESITVNGKSGGFGTSERGYTAGGVSGGGNATSNYSSQIVPGIQMSTTSGHGEGASYNFYGDSWVSRNSRSNGSPGKIVVFRGNTNIPLDVQNARDITTNALAITALAQEQTGILLSLA